MSTVDAISSLNNSSTKATPDAFSELSSTNFIEIMFTELTNQDPFEPNDSQAILEQLNSLRSIQSDIGMMDRLDNLVDQNEFAAASTLIGAIVSGVSEQNTRVVGFVDTVIQTDDGPILRLDDGSKVRLSNIDEVASPAILGNHETEDTGDGSDPGSDSTDDDSEDNG